MLQPDEDAFGKHLLDHLESRTGTALLERDDGLSRPALQAPNFFTSFDEWWSSEKEAMQHVHGRVLDVGCGAGRHALYLQERGHDVVAIDISPLAVEVAHRRGVKRAEVMDLRAIGPDLGTFDTVLMLCGGFGLFGSREGAIASLRGLDDVTTDAGVVVAESVDATATSDTEALAYIRRNIECGRMPGQMRLRIRYGDSATPWADWLNASRHDVQDIVAQTRWRVSHTIEENEAEFVVVLKKEA